MIYVQIRDTKGNVLAKPKSVKEAIPIAEKLRDERKESIEIWDTTPIKKTANFYEFGYHRTITVCYNPKQPKFLIKVGNDDWTEIKAGTEENFNDIVNIVKKYNPDKNVENKN